jgi:urea transport system permease protein
MRDKEDRVRFSGYDVADFRIFVFCLAAALSGIGGALFSLQVGFMSPSFVGIVPSVEMVIYAAVGGRMSLVGAVYGTLLVNAGKTYFSETFPEMWLFLMAALFIGVTMAFPMGLAGLWESHVVPRWTKWRGKKNHKPVEMTSAAGMDADAKPVRVATPSITSRRDVSGQPLPGSI